MVRSAWLRAAFCALFCSGWVALASAAPGSDIYIADGQTLEASEALVTGIAHDAVGIAGVSVAVQDRITGRWLQSDGTWGTTIARHAANLATQQVLETRWLFRRRLPTGEYQVDALATSSDGSVEPFADRPVRNFSVIADRPGVDPAAPLLTIHFGRVNWGVAGVGVCTPYADPVNGSVFLDEVAEFLTDRGYTAEGSVPFGHVSQDPNVRLCPNRTLATASINDLAMLRDDHGWTFVGDSIGPLPSNPIPRPGMDTLSCPDQITNAAASLAELYRLGHVRSWGLYAGANEGMNTTIRDAVSSRLYSLTRRYTNRENTAAKALAGDWAYFRSVIGGYCNDPAATCYDHSVVPMPTGRYVTPDDLLTSMIAAPGAWRGVQFYRFVRGANIPGGYPGTPTAPAGSTRETYWDCRSSDARLHWTSREEVYCYRDFVDAVEELYSAHPDVVTTDAAHVATSWGLGNANFRTTFPVCGTTPGSLPAASAVTVSGQPVTGQTLTGNYSYADADGDPEGASAYRWLRNGGTAIPAATSRTYAVIDADIGATLTFEVTPVALTGDSPGAPVRSAPTAVVIAGNRSPTVKVTSPPDGAILPVGSIVTLAATFGDPDGDPVSLIWKADGSTVASPWTPGSRNHTIVATAEDDEGARATDSVQISVLPPTLTGRSVNNGKTWTALVRLFAIAGASVTGTWSSPGGTGGCTVALTATQCEFAVSKIAKKQGSITFTASTGTKVAISKP
jgi:hypothetical protein